MFSRYWEHNYPVMSLLRSAAGGSELHLHVRARRKTPCPQDKWCGAGTKPSKFHQFHHWWNFVIFISEQRKKKPTNRRALSLSVYLPPQSQDSRSFFNVLSVLYSERSSFLPQAKNMHTGWSEVLNHPTEPTLLAGLFWVLFKFKLHTGESTQMMILVQKGEILIKVGAWRCDIESLFHLNFLRIGVWGGTRSNAMLEVILYIFKYLSCGCKSDRAKLRK